MGYHISALLLRFKTLLHKPYNLSSKYHLQWPNLITLLMLNSRYVVRFIHNLFFIQIINCHFNYFATLISKSAYWHISTSNNELSLYHNRRKYWRRQNHFIAFVIAAFQCKTCARRVCWQSLSSQVLWEPKTLCFSSRVVFYGRTL